MTGRSRMPRDAPISSTASQNLSEGFETAVGEADVALSEGEKQRITIARALLRDAPILILDEPTSALDVETEALVTGGDRNPDGGRTTFIIAHRLSTIRTCDQIVVLRDGGIAEQGTLSQLLRRNGVFASYYRTQFLTEPGPSPVIPLSA